MYATCTTHRAAFLTWKQRNLLSDLIAADHLPLDQVTSAEIGKRLGIPNPHWSLVTLSRRGFADINVLEGGTFAWFITDYGIEAINSLEGDNNDDD